MIARSSTAKAVSLMIATGLVAGVVQHALPAPAVEIEGGGPPVEARMGSRFEDMAVGTLRAVEPESALPAQEEFTSAEQVEAEALRPLATLQAITPQASASLAAQVGEPQAAYPVVPNGVLPAVPAPTETASPAPAPQVVAAQEPDSDAPTLSMRPVRKNPERAAEAAQELERVRTQRAEKQAAERAATRQAARGNAQRNNTRGAQSGTSITAKAQQSGVSKRVAPQAGNAAVSNYPGQVMRRISRLAKPRVRAKGTAVIAFSVSSGGGLAGVSVARSSGSAELDRAALSLIRRAAPFPRPPSGAQRQFSIEIKGR
jgi:protein TonB